MFKQSQVLRTLSAPSAGMRLQEVLADQRLRTRTAMARQVCEDFGFVDAKGKPQVGTCITALEKLAKREVIVLPAPQNNHASGASPRRLADAVPQPVDVPTSADRVQEMRVVMVERPEQRIVWNTLMHHEHPGGTTTFFGAQVRYLIDSAHGYLGAAGFAAPTVRLAPREQWMGWNEQQRYAYRNRVRCLKRFLVRDACRNLASHMLGCVLRRLGDDFEERYGYRPWLVETYVAPPRKGTCFKAADFRHIGYTAGGKHHADAAEAAPKAVFLYELDRNWRTHLGDPKVKYRPELSPHDGMDSGQWAENEFGGAPLGDKRLSARLVKSASLLADVMRHPITAQPNHDVAAVKGHYRLFSSKNKNVTGKNILAPHRARTIARMRGQDTVLCIQDGSTLNYATRPGCEGLQVIGTNQTKAQTRGLPLHVTLATTAEGVPLGVLRASFRNPETGPLKPGTQQWLDGLHDICAAATEVPRTCRIIGIMDREGDTFALFDALREQADVEVLVRAKHDRKLTNGRRLFNKLRSGPPACTMEINLQRITARPKSSKKKAVRGRKFRKAQCEVRHHKVMLPDPDKKAPPVTMYGVHVREMRPPAGAKAIEWFLLASFKVNNAWEAIQCLQFYTKRWRVEDFFRVLKTGCKVEDQALRTAERLSRVITVYCVIAFRLMLLVLLGRTVPELDPSVFFTEEEILILTKYAKYVRLPAPKTLQEATLLVAVMGGYLNRSRDGPPGFQIMWRGMEVLFLARFVCEFMGIL